MAKRNDDSGGFLFKTGAFALLAGLAYWLFSTFGAQKSAETTETAPPEKNKTEQSAEPAPPKNSDPTTNTELKYSENWLPSSTTGEVVRHKYFALSYAEDHEQAEWVAWELTRDRLNNMVFERGNTFLPDPAVRTESATPRDYSGSGFDKGHLCPAADMGFESQAMDETFLMSNISPQRRGFNAGIWRELEELTRDWARRFGHLYIIAGAVLPAGASEQIGFSKVSVPLYFYRILLTEKGGRAIAFILPNEASDRPVMDFATTIDRVEKSTGIDFFQKYLTALDEELEGSLDKSAWKIDEKRFKQRVEEWNK